MKKLLLFTVAIFLFGGVMAQFNVTMNVDMSELEGFDPETHSVYVSGSIFEWPEPGTNEDLKLERVEETLIYTITAEMAEAGEIQYKYFSDAVGAGWDGGEWTGDPNRKIYAVGETTLDDVWADQPFEVTFNVDMTDAEGFNPETDEVFMAGTVNVANNWQEPGTDPSLQLFAGDDPMIYSTTLLLYAGDYEYKYFRVIDGVSSWDNGEWDGVDNREISVSESRTFDDIWGILSEPGARVQVIHNSADAAAAVVDVWLDDVLLLDDFAFRTASPFIDAPAGEEFTIAIKGPDSEDPMDPIWSQAYTLEDGKTYVLVANGIVSEEGYDPIVPFDIYVYDIGREDAEEGTTDVLVFHGATDAPTVSVYEVSDDPTLLVETFEYGTFAGYLELPLADYSIQIRNEAGDAEVATYSAPLATLGLDGAAVTVVASGFLAPANNSDGPLFALYTALATGGALVELPFISSIDEISSSTPAMNIYPNPAQNFLNIEMLEETSKIEIFNVIGESVMTIDQVTSEIMSINTSEWSNGVYFITIHTDSGVQTAKFMKN